MIELISTPAYPSPGSPDTAEQWLATESPNNFRLQRKDWGVIASSDPVGSPSVLVVTLDSDFTGNIGDDIAVHDSVLDIMYTGKVVSIATPSDTITTDIAWLPAMSNIDYLNDNTLHGGYYFEGFLTINGAPQTLTVIASPDTKGIADLDVSGVLRITTQIGKIGTYGIDPVTKVYDPLLIIQKETNKSGSFTFKYRECWYGSSELYTEEGTTWYYVEAVRSEEQGSNLHEFVPSDITNAPFFNSFERPVYTPGLPFDLSIFVPGTTPHTTSTIIIKRYDATKTLLGQTSVDMALASLKGFLCSVAINTTSFEATVSYLTCEITSA